MKDDFLLEYASETMTKSKGCKREEDYEQKKEKGSFLFFLWRLLVRAMSFELVADMTELGLMRF